MFKHHFRSLFLFCLVISFFAPLCASPAHQNGSDSTSKFNRNQMLLVNLKSAPLSSGYYLLHSYGDTKEIIRNLERSLNQVISTDKLYAKSKHRPDDRYLGDVSLKITVARQTAEQLETEIKEAYAELKSSIEQALISDADFRG